jgi:hypothetical protein
MYIFLKYFLFKNLLKYFNDIYIFLKYFLFKNLLKYFNDIFFHEKKFNNTKIDIFNGRNVVNQ